MYDFISNDLRKRFVKDFKLPIQLVHGGYFEYFINLYDKLFDSKRKAQLLVDAVEECGGSEQFAGMVNSLQQNIMNKLVNSAAFKHFSACDMDIFKSTSYSLPNVTKNIFINQNTDQTLVSIDMIKANFQVLNTYFPEVLMDCTSYDELVATFMWEEDRPALFNYIKESKGTRQYIFGNLNPKRQQQIQKYHMNKILNDLIGREVITVEDVIFSNADELVVNFNLNIKAPEGTKLTSFKLEEVECAGVTGFVQTFEDESIKIHNVSSILFAQFYKAYTGQEILDIDKSFYYEGRVAQFLDDVVEVVS